MKKIKSLTGIDIKLPERFFEEYDKALNIRKFGTDNLYPQNLKDLMRAECNLSRCVNRLATHLFGEYVPVGLLDSDIVGAICDDMALFYGFALHVNYNGLGDINSVNYVPFESVRLCEQGSNGKYTQCYVCSDWAGVRTVNKKKVDPKKDAVQYNIFTTNLETRLMRMEACGGAENYKGEILYFSNNAYGYPISPADSILNLVSASIGIQNATYRDVRNGMQPAVCLSVPAGGTDDNDSLAEDLASIQGDDNLGKILLFEFNDKDEKPEVLNLGVENYDGRFEKSKDYIESKILEVYGQEAFKKLMEGGWGFSSSQIAEIYAYYNFSLRGIRNKMEAVLRQIEPSFVLAELEYPVPDSVIPEGEGGNEI